MRTSLNELKAIDDHLFRLMPGADNFLFEARLMLDDELRTKVFQQQETHVLIQEYGRKQLKTEIDAVHQRLFNDTRPHSFAAKILRLFK